MELTTDISSAHPSFCGVNQTNLYTKARHPKGLKVVGNDSVDDLLQKQLDQMQKMASERQDSFSDFSSIVSRERAQND